jgi:hypothetical protein
MNLLSSILFWIGIALLVDGSLGLLFQERWQKLAENLDIRRIALIESGAGLILLTIHYVLLQGR